MDPLQEIYDYDKSDRKLLLRQILIWSVIFINSIMCGLGVGALTVIVPQFNKKLNSTEVIGDEMLSWMASLAAYGAVPWVLILTLLAHYVGRKTTLISATIITALGFVSLYLSTKPWQLFLSQAILAVTLASVKTTQIMLTTEYTSPKYRGVISCLKSANFLWGIWISNALGTFCHWTIIPMSGLAASIYLFLVALIIPESPYWLASKKNFNKCANAHRWLKGVKADAKNELNVLIRAYQTDERNLREKKTFYEFILKYYCVLQQPKIYRPVLCCFLLICVNGLTGKIIFTVYSLQIIKQITKSEYWSYVGMLIIDGFSIFGMYIGSILARYLKRRSMLLIISSGCIVLFCIMSLYFFLSRILIIKENHYLSLSLLVIYSMCVCCGPVVLSSAIYCELLPLKCRSLCIVMCAIFTKLENGTQLKLGLSIFKMFDVHGTFLLLAVCLSVALLLVYKFVPETSGKTLNEIANSFRSQGEEESTNLMAKNINFNQFKE